MTKTIKFKKNVIFKRVLFLIMLVIAFYVIFNLSAQNGEESGSLSRRVTEIIVDLVSKIKTINFTQKLYYIEKLHPVVRKLAHFTVYTFVGFSIMGFMCTFDIRNIFKFIISFGVGATYAITDEVHQSFIPGRGPSIMDVGIDSLGVLTGIFILTILIVFIEAIVNWLKMEKMKNKVINILKNNKQWYMYILFICLIVFLFILLNVLNNKIAVFDTNIYNSISVIKKNVVTSIFKVITEFGSARTLIVIALASLVIVKNRKIGTAICINLASVGLLNQILKNIIQRPRPEGFRLVEERGYSFPSGHSMASMAFYGLIIYFILKNVKNKTIRNICCAALGVLIFLIGISRIYLGVHYASDVLAGFLISIAYLIVYIIYILKLIGIKEK